MRKILFHILLSAALLQSFSMKAGFMIRQEIRYVSKEASSVYLVWGIDNWQMPPVALRPEGSFIKDKLLYTPMKKKSYGFRAQVVVPANTKVDYVFWITGGPAGKPADVWDINAPEKDYHSLVLQNNISIIEQKIKIRSKEPLTLLDFATPLLSCSVTFQFFILVLRTLRFGKEFQSTTEPGLLVLSAGFVLAVLLIFARASVVGLGADFYLSPFTYFPKVFWAGFYDVLVVMIFTIVFLVLLKFLKSAFLKKLSACLYLVLSFLLLIAGILNMRVVEMIGKPFSYPWFYYSDFLKSSDARSAISSNISAGYCIDVLMICMAGILLTVSVNMIAGLIAQKLQSRRVLGTSLVCCSAVYMAAGPHAIREYDWEYEKLANPVVEFAGSMSLFSGIPQLFTMPVDDTMKVTLPPKRIQPFSSKLPGVKNVVIFVMESTAAEYVQPYSTAFNLTPQLEKCLGEAVVFDNVYAHAPATNNSMVSILGSVYPWLSYNSLTREHPAVPMPTISSELKEYGYRTAFFNSADNRFQKAGEFLSKRKFDQVVDCNTLNCEGFEVRDEKWEFLDGKDDRCTAEQMMNWITAEKDSAFFAMMWTYQTHYPYFAGGDEEYYSADPVQNRYLNAVHHTDEVFGELVAGLKKKGLYESTLIVVVGDHGEAFGRHGQTTHASGIYEENLHVPCVFINPAFKGLHHNGMGGLVDIAPTIMNCLGYNSAFQWEGRNLFTLKYADRVYFFTPWSDYLFGFREGSRKYIFNATKNKEEVYDLEKDPFESADISGDLTSEKPVFQQRLAAWVQAVNARTEQRISGERQ